HSYKNPVHERKVRDIAEEVVKKFKKDIKVFASIDYYPVRKESHRTNTTIVEAYAAEPSRASLNKVDKTLKDFGADFDLRIMASHGGTISTRANELARTCVSGPIGGMIGAKYLSEYLGIDNVACSDIGGSRFAIGLITQVDLRINSDPDMDRPLLSFPPVSIEFTGSGTGCLVRV